jgi:SAM-dependent methyltransferase
MRRSGADLSGPVYRPALRRAARILLPLLFRGNKVRCPCCGRTWRRFVRRHRWDALCPGCLSLSRHRLLWLYLRDETDVLERRQAVLHFAPEEALTELLAPLVPFYIRADLAPQSRETVKADITALPFGDDAFDTILCSHVLEHVAEDTKAMTELYRVLKPGGQLYLLQPVRLKSAETYEDPSAITPAERRRLFGQRDHVRIYGRDIIGRLEDAGFDVALEHYLRRLEPEWIELYGLSDEPIFVCRKLVTRP